MEFDLTGEHARYAYRLPGGLVTPRPIAWRSEDAPRDPGELCPDRPHGSPGRLLPHLGPFQYAPT